MRFRIKKYRHKIFDSKKIFYLFFLLLILLSGHAQGNNQKSFVLKERSSSLASVDAAMAAVFELENNSAAQKALISSHKDWLKLRKSHCAAIRIYDHSKESTKLEECYEAFDRQRIEFLNHHRIWLLINAPSYGYPNNLASNINYSSQIKSRPSALISLIAASNAPIAAVTFKDHTEIIDLVNGQIFSIIQTLDDEQKTYTFSHFLSPNGRILTTSYRGATRGFKVWDTIKGELLRDRTLSPYHIHLQLYDGKNFICSEKNRIGIYDISKDTVAWYAEGKDSISHMSLSHDNTWLIVVRHGNIELWEFKNLGEGKLTLTLRNSAAVSNYDYQPNSISFSLNKEYFYASQIRGSILTQWKIPDLKISRRIQFPEYKHIKLLQSHQADPFLMEAKTSYNDTKAYYLMDIAKEKSLRIFELSGPSDKIINLGGNQILIATPFSLRTSNVKSSSEFKPFNQVFDSVLYHPVPIPITKPYKYSIVQPNIKKEECKNFKIEGIGVYEGEPQRPVGYIKVHIGPTEKPIKLVLASYESVIWQLDTLSGAKLQEVLLAGPNGSRVEGLNKIQVTYIGNAYAYKESNMSLLNHLVQKQTGCYIEHFQGAYKGKLFYIGQITSSDLKESNKFLKYIDEEGNVVYRNF